MIRTQIQLDSAEYERLRQVADRLNRSISDCIREGVGLFLQKAPEGSGDDFSDIAGKFRPQPRSSARTLDDDFADAILESKTGKKS